MSNRQRAFARWFVRTGAGVLTWTLVISTAGAHAYLLRSEPGPGRLAVWPAGGPAAIRLWFEERVEVAFTAISVLDPAGNSVEKRQEIAWADGNTMATVPVAPTAPGAYRLTQRVLSTDSHVTQGELRFDVALASPGPDQKLERAPSEITLAFPAALGVTGLQLTLTRSGERVLQDAAHQAGDAFRLKLPPNLKSGEYTVTWQAEQRSGSSLGGSFQFRVE